MRFLLLAVVATLGLGCERVVLYWMTPSEAFDPGQLPAPPDWSPASRLHEPAALFFADIRENAARRLLAWQDGR